MDIPGIRHVKCSNSAVLGYYFVFCSTSDDSYLVIGKWYSRTTNLKHSFAVPLDYPG